MRTVDSAEGGALSAPSGDAVRIDIEALFDPFVLMSAVRDAEGRIVDFGYLAANAAACADLGLTRGKLLASTLLELNPGAGDRTFFKRLVGVVETGEPLTLEDFESSAAAADGGWRYYDASATKIGDGVGLAWWDVTLRYQRDRTAARSEAELRGILDALLDPFEVLAPVRDARGRIVDLQYVQVNAAAARYLAKEPAELVGRTLRQVWSGGLMETVINWAKQILETGDPLSLDAVTLATPDGRLRQVDIRGVKVGDAVSFTHRDVTARVESARQIAESREHFRLLAENASEVVFQAGPDAHVCWVSPSVTRALGWELGEVVGRPLADFLHPDDLAAAAAAWRQALIERGASGQAELRLATSDGGWRWMSGLGRALFDDDGNRVGAVGALRDIQAQRDAQDALADSEERFRRSMMDAAIGMCMVAPTGHVIRANPAMCALLGRDEASLMQCRWQDITHPEDLAADEAMQQQVLAGERETYRLAKRYLRPGGEPVWADLTVSCVRDEQGEVRYLIAQIIDITDSVRAREALARSEEHYRLLAENSSDVVFRASLAGVLEWASPSATEVLGWKPEQVLGRSILDYVVNSDIPADLHITPENRERIDFQGRIRTAAGPTIWMDISTRPIIDEAGRLIGRMGRLRDVQTEHAALEALRNSEQRFRTAMESAPTGMAVVGLDRRFVEVNPALCQLLGRSEQWLLSRSLADVMDPLDDDLDQRLRAQLLAGLVPSLTRDHQMIRSDGARVLVEQSIGLLRDDRGQPSAYVSQFADVTEARQTREKLRFLATHDSLTELLNRRELVTRISGILGRSPRTGGNVGVLFIDLDGLKPVNDTYGHAVGDGVIVTVARRIRDQVRSDDALARFGGDEFVLVLPAIHSAADAERIAESLHRAVEVPMDIDGHDIRMTISIGVSVAHPGQDPGVAMQRADAALYRAKREGRARTAVYNPASDGI